MNKSYVTLHRPNNTVQMVDNVSVIKMKSQHLLHTSLHSIILIQVKLLDSCLHGYCPSCTKYGPVETYGISLTGGGGGVGRRIVQSITCCMYIILVDDSFQL